MSTYLKTHSDTGTTNVQQNGWNKGELDSTEWEHTGSHCIVLSSSIGTQQVGSALQEKEVVRQAAQKEITKQCNVSSRPVPCKRSYCFTKTVQHNNVFETSFKNLNQQGFSFLSYLNNVPRDRCLYKFYSQKNHLRNKMTASNQ